MIIEVFEEERVPIREQALICFEAAHPDIFGWSELNKIEYELWGSTLWLSSEYSGG